MHAWVGGEHLQALHRPGGVAKLEQQQQQLSSAEPFSSSQFCIAILPPELKLLCILFPTLLLFFCFCFLVLCQRFFFCSAPYALSMSAPYRKKPTFYIKHTLTFLLCFPSQQTESRVPVSSIIFSSCRGSQKGYSLHARNRLIMTVPCLGATVSTAPAAESSFLLPKQANSRA